MGGLRLVLVNTVMENSKFLELGLASPPYWAAILARKIRARGHDAILLDMQFQDYKRPRIPGKYCKGIGAALISGMIQNYPQMIRMSEFYRRKGIPVIFGGWGPTSLYHSRNRISLDAHLFRFCDAAVIGEAETTIDDLLKDLGEGKPRKLYLPNPREWDWVMPDFTIWDREYSFGAVQTQRGCPEGCKFCSVTNLLGPKVRAKPKSMVRDEIRLLLRTRPYDLIFFCDDNITGKDGGEYARGLLQMFRKEFPGTSWFSQCTTRIADNRELMDLFAESRCALLIVGFESVQRSSLGELTSKNFSMATDAEREQKYRELVKELKKRRICVWGCFIYGFEHDTKETFRHALEFALTSGILVYQATLLTPQPGTPFFSQSLDRLLYPLTPENWGRYDFLQPTMRYHSTQLDNRKLMKYLESTARAFYSKSLLKAAWNTRLLTIFLKKLPKMAADGSMLRLLSLATSKRFSKPISAST